MSISYRSFLRGLLASSLVLAFLAVDLSAQDASPDEKQMRRVIGSWTLNPLASDAPEPTPPPIYASYRKKGEPAPPALDTIPRILLEIQDGKLTGKGVLPKGLPMTDENRDVSGKEPVALEDLSFAGDQLTFKVHQGDEVFEASAKLEGRVLKGTWSLGSKKGALFLHRRYR